MADRQRQGARSRRREGSQRQGIEKTIMGVPARIMRPRLFFLVTVGLLVGFGLLMIFSASSMTALSESGDPATYLRTQAAGTALGALFAYGISRVDYRLLRSQLAFWVMYIGMLVILGLIFFIGIEEYGATRWIPLGPISFQPSEAAKIILIIISADFFDTHARRGDLNSRGSRFEFLWKVILPLFMIFEQPDKGTTGILLATILLMAFFAGVSWKVVVPVLIAAGLLLIAYSLRDEYSRARIAVAWDPWSDRYGDGYQLVQGFLAFGSGGLFGLGIGMSKQKYSYLPMAHNDFIFAVIGEECGLVGCVGVLVGFGILVWAGFKIARYAPDLMGSLLAAGISSLLVIQTFVNIAGVVGITPLTGKPIPFLSYGGTSAVFCLIMVGVVWSVSRRSVLPETSHDAERRRMRVERGRGGEPARDGFAGSLVGEPQPRSARRLSQGGRPQSGRGLTMVDGGATSPRASRPRGEGRGRVSTDKNGRKRIDLGPSAQDRLRGGSRGSDRRR